MNAAFKKDLKICKPNSTHPLVIFPMSAPGLHTCLTFIRHQFRPPRSVLYNPAKTCGLSRPCLSFASASAVLCASVAESLTASRSLVLILLPRKAAAISERRGRHVKYSQKIMERRFSTVNSSHDRSLTAYLL